MSLSKVVPRIAGKPLQRRRCHVGPQHRLPWLGMVCCLLDLLSLH